MTALTGSLSGRLRGAPLRRLGLWRPSRRDMGETGAGSSVRVRDVGARRGRRQVLSDVNLDVTGGQICFIGGANGAGKSTLLRVVAGLNRHTGHVERPLGVAFVPEKAVVVASLGVEQWLDQMRQLRGEPPIDWPTLFRESGLGTDVLAMAAGSLSKGMFQRVALIEALAADVQLRLLDEPFSGLDASGREWLVNQLGARRQQGAMVIFTDHTSTSRDLAVDLAVELRDGRAWPLSALPAAPPVAADLVQIVWQDEAGRRRIRMAAPEESDRVLGDLLREGSHVMEVRPA